MKHAALLLLVFSLAAQAQEPLFRIPPARASVEIDRQPIAITAWGEVRSGPHPDAYALALSLDLSDLQAHVTEILKAHVDRSDQCGERLNILRATLTPEAPIAVLTAEMHVERWACAKAFGKNIVKRLVGGDTTVRVTLAPVLASPTEAHLEATVRDIQADGSLGDLLRSGSLGDAIREKIRSSVQSALDKAMDFRTAVPPILQELVRLQTVQFRDAGEGRLLLAVGAAAAIPSQRMEQLREASHLR